MSQTSKSPSESAFDETLRLHHFQVTRIHTCGCCERMILQLEAEGPHDALEVMKGFVHASWLNDLELPYLHDLLNLPNEEHRNVNLREEGWAALEDDGRWVRVSNTYGSADSCALVQWDEFREAMQLKRRFLCLMRDCIGRGVPRYSTAEGFRARLHAPGHMPKSENCQLNS